MVEDSYKKLDSFTLLLLSLLLNYEKNIFISD